MRGRAARLLLPSVVVVGLVGVVAIAATGSTDRGTSRGRPPSATLLDTLLSIGALALVAGAVLFLYGLTQRKAIAREVASGRYRRFGFVSYAALMLVFLVVTYFRLRNWERPSPQEEDPTLAGGRTPPTDLPTRSQLESTYEPRIAWVAVLVVVGLAVAGGIAYFLAARRRAAVLDVDASLAETLADVLDDTLDDLRAEIDPRKAVIAAYARLERVLAAHGVPRRPAETPEEYLRRVLDDLAIDARATRRLTDLFSRAKFSQHAVDRGMKEDAIQALEDVRDGLREARVRPELTPPSAAPATGAGA
jgi:hypothetical protein